MKLGQYLQIGFFLLFIYLGTGLMWSLGGNRVFSETENRNLAPLPQWSTHALWSGQYLHDIENYVADHVPYRDALVGLSKLVEAWEGLTLSQDAVIVASNADNTGQAAVHADEEPAATMNQPPSQGPEVTVRIPDAAPTPVPSPQPKPDMESKAQKPGHVIGKVLIVEHRAVNLFSYISSAGKLYAETINHVKAAMDAHFNAKIPVSVLIAPTGAEFMQSEQLRKLSASQQEAIHEVYQQLNPDITPVDALSMLQNHAEDAIFFRTDHHWTATGAYYGYAAFMKAKGESPIPLEKYEKAEVAGFLGSLYSATRNSKLEKHPDMIVVYKPYVKHEYTVHYAGPLKMDLLDMSHAQKKNKYRIFLSGDRPWGRITTEINNGKRLAVIKDSYGNALIPFLLPHYNEIYVIDPRQFTKSLVPFMEEHQIQELLFINNSDVLSNPDFMQLVRGMS
ncbi:hypothetical protein GCM10023310_65760 [Paenibacillus vulneris]|uniref:DHHW family protein n=1 Tax=Paenibacillus vulneris TaxID=1133364 RepID=A0ABW3UKA0_9BACL